MLLQDVQHMSKQVCCAAFGNAPPLVPVPVCMPCRVSSVQARLRLPHAPDLFHFYSSSVIVLLWGVKSATANLRVQMCPGQISWSDMMQTRVECLLGARVGPAVVLYT